MKRLLHLEFEWVSFLLYGRGCVFFFCCVIFILWSIKLLFMYALPMGLFKYNNTMPNRRRPQEFRKTRTNWWLCLCLKKFFVITENFHWSLERTFPINWNDKNVPNGSPLLLGGYILLYPQCRSPHIFIKM